jgi:enediyne biosynthesis protein E4
MRAPFLVLTCPLILTACGSEAPGDDPARSEPSASGQEESSQGLPPRAPGGWPEEAAARGLDYVNISGEASKPTILEANGAGVALLDLGSDGDLDVVFSQGMDALEKSYKGPGADLQVYLNDGTGHFEKTTGPGVPGWWTGLATGDLNNDGRTDLVAGGYGRLEVFLQNEEGRLESWQDLISHGPGERLIPGVERYRGNYPLWSTSVALFDADGDGVLDLFAGHYLKMDPVAPDTLQIDDGQLSLPCRWKGHDVYCGPRGLKPQGDRIYRGLGTGAFHQFTAQWLPQHVPGFTLAVLPSDIDGDGDTDLMVANDSSANLLLINDGKGVFTDHAYESGVAFSADGNPQAGMGLSMGDVNRDGLFDYAVTNFSDEPTNLYFGSKSGFSDETFRFGLGAATRALLSWGVHLEDFDGDGWLELFTANGHVYPQADEDLTGTSYAQADTLWKLGPLAKVDPIEPLAQDSILSLQRATRGSAVGDVDGDGRPDLVLVYIDGPCGLGMNRTGDGNHRLALKLSGPPTSGPRDRTRRYTPRDAMGARVTVVLGGEAEPFALIREVQTSQGYQSASSSTLHFGLGEYDEYDSILVQWPSGELTELPGGPVDRTLFIEEGKGIVKSEEWK